MCLVIDTFILVVINKANELVPCEGKMEKYIVKGIDGTE